jgi:hypothetical protein
VSYRYSTRHHLKRAATNNSENVHCMLTTV